MEEPRWAHTRSQTAGRKPAQPATSAGGVGTGPSSQLSREAHQRMAHISRSLTAAGTGRVRSRWTIGQSARRSTAKKSSSAGGGACCAVAGSSESLTDRLPASLAELPAGSGAAPFLNPIFGAPSWIVRSSFSFAVEQRSALSRCTLLDSSTVLCRSLRRRHLLLASTQLLHSFSWLCCSERCGDDQLEQRYPGFHPRTQQ